MCLKSFFRALLLPALLLALSQGLYSQEASAAALPDFLSIEQNLDALENLISDTLKSNETLIQQLQDLERNLSEQEQLLTERENSLAAQENLLRELRQRLNEMSATYKAQSELSRKYESNSRFWRTFTIIGIPTAAVISAGVTVLFMAR
jgi:septal ring factor EnvC (AmiA/AmiB activator)